MSAKRRRPPRIKGQYLLLLGLLLLLILPFALRAVKNPVNYLPRAYIRDQAVSLEAGTNSPPTLEGSTFNPIHCRLNQPCRHTFKGTDKDLYDTLALTADFLPPELKLSDCQTSQTFTGAKRLNCQLTGTPTQTGTYKILVTLTDGTSTPVSKPFTLDVP
ncbi:hypothetical protein A2W24_04930 [Microgenomates group bacterium RBG_16_45_19]|nr:MAG: hypothetical protein A2W24_04930 [Microgenomates group bacterium RBG_16_45_19]